MSACTPPASLRSFAELAAPWSARWMPILRRPRCARPAVASYSWHGKRGVHTEHLGHLLAEMQHLQRTYPGLRW